MIDLSLLPPPDVVESVDFEELYQETLGIFREFMKDQWTAALESDPVVKLMEVMAYREMLTRARVNAAAKASLLAFAKGNDLVNRAADYGVEKLTIRPADPDAVPPVEAVMEGDEALRYRTRLSLEALSVAGSSGAYEYHGLSASAELTNVSVDSPRFVGAELTPAVRAQLPPGAIVVVCDYDAGLANRCPATCRWPSCPAPPAPRRWPSWSRRSRRPCRPRKYGRSPTDPAWPPVCRLSSRWRPSCRLKKGQTRTW